MVARTIVEAERHANLEAFEEALAKLEGVTEEHVVALRRRAATATASRSPYPHGDDALGQAAYMAAALRALSEAVATLQGNTPAARKAS